MPAPDPAEDLALLVEAARAAGELASQYAGPTPVLHEKPGGQGPVTEADLAVDRLLHQRLTEARPEYGWLSEETLDGPGRLARRRVSSSIRLTGRALLPTGWIAGRIPWRL